MPNDAGRTVEAPRRNDRCPCGSGMRYKHCCGETGAATEEPGSLAALMTAALRHHQAGSLPAAERCYRQALRLAPEQADCLHMLGAVCYQTGRLLEAAQFIGRALALTGWQFPAMRENITRVFSHLVGQPQFVQALIAEATGALVVDAARTLAAPFGDPITLRPVSFPSPCAAEEAGSRLAFTGERFTPEESGQIWSEHWHRYALVLPFVRGLRVLDAACGEGYGSALLAGGAREVVGIDVSGEAIAHAQRRYAGGNLRFVSASVDRLPFADASFDAIVSFETIEHLSRQAEMLAEFRRVLAPTGWLVISSPNKPVYSDASQPVNHFHVRELTRDELASMLMRDFPRQRWYGQRMLAHPLIWAERLAPQSVDAEGQKIVGAPWTLPVAPMYFVVACGAHRASLPELPGVSALTGSAGDAALVSLPGLLGLRSV